MFEPAVPTNQTSITIGPYFCFASAFPHASLHSANATHSHDSTASSFNTAATTRTQSHTTWHVSPGQLRPLQDSRCPEKYHGAPQPQHPTVPQQSHPSHPGGFTTEAAAAPQNATMHRFRCNPHIKPPQQSVVQCIAIHATTLIAHNAMLQVEPACSAHHLLPQLPLKQQDHCQPGANISCSPTMPQPVC